jgi:hypothetical protein
MVYAHWRLEHVPYRNETWNNDDAVLVTDAYDILLSVGEGDSKDTFEFKLKNINGRYNSIFNPMDKIVIYRAINTDTITENNLLMVGLVQDVPDETTDKSDYIRVTGGNYSELVAGAIIFADAKELPINEALQRALIQQSREGFNIGWHPSNPTLRQDGTPFPKTGEKWFYWTLKKILERYSSEEYTKDGAYFWYITNDNKLRWFSKNDTGAINTYSFDAETTPVKNIKTVKDIDGVRNFVIIKGGRSPAGTAIQTVVVDQASVNRHGRRVLFHISENNTADTIIREDIGDSPNKYPENYSGFVTKWLYYIDGSGTATEEIAGVTCTDGQPVSGITTDKQYNAVVIQHIKNRLRLEGRRIIDALIYGKYKIDLGFSPNQVTWVLGDVINTKLPKLFGTIKQLRVEEIQFSENMDTYSLVEDIGSLGKDDDNEDD